MLALQLETWAGTLGYELQDLAALPHDYSAILYEQTALGPTVNDADTVLLMCGNRDVADAQPIERR